MVYLAVFFVVPLISLARMSLSKASGSIFLPPLTFSWDFGNYVEAFGKYQEQILRSFGYALTATVLCILLSFPLAYVIAFKAGRFKNLLLGLVLLPFFVTFLIRTTAWKTILADNGWVVDALGAIGLLPEDGRLLSTRRLAAAGRRWAGAAVPVPSDLRDRAVLVQALVRRPTWLTMPALNGISARQVHGISPESVAPTGEPG